MTKQWVAANAVEESPGHEDLLEWERRLVAGNHDPNFPVTSFFSGKTIGSNRGGGGREDA